MSGFEYVISAALLACGYAGAGYLGRKLWELRRRQAGMERRP